MDIENKMEWSNQDLHQLLRAISEIKSVKLEEDAYEKKAFVDAVTRKLKEQAH